MSMDGKDLKTLIDEQMKDVDVPDSLKPENIETLLAKKGQKRKKNYYKKMTAAAACGAVILGIAAAGAGGLFSGESSGGNHKQVSDDAAGEMESATESCADDSGAKAVNEIRAAEDYDEIYQYIKEEYDSRNQTYDLEWGYVEDTAEAYSTDGASAEAKSSSTESTAAAMDIGASADYSDTNIREEGVGEGDIVKTDGKRLYILNNRRIQIVGIEQEEMEPLGCIVMDEEDYVSEIYIKNEKLIVVYTRSEYQVEDGSSGGVYKEYTVAETFDVSDPENPKSAGKISQSGNYNTMRMVGDYVYLFSNFYADVSSAKSYTNGYIPEVQGKLLDSGSILMPMISRGNQYTVVSSFSLKNPEEKVDSKAIFGASGMCYVSGKNIYICEGYYDSEESNVTQTCIRKVAFEDGKLEAVGQTRIDGTLNDSFSIDEYEGKLRLVVTVSPTYSSSTFPISILRTEDVEEKTVEKDSNSLYILDADLNEISRIEGLAEDEQIYSARFMGDTGYFVTFRQVDPLFSMDLSDPEKPEIIGKLKIPGFSDYLHPYGEGLLLGIGMAVDEEGVATEGVKLSMFDVSDPSDVEEVQKYVLEDIYSTDVSYNYKAALVNAEKNLIGFPAYGQEQHYYIFSYDEDGFSCVFDRELVGYYSDVRALYVGDRLYLTAGNTVEAFNLETFDKVDDIVL